MNNTEYNLAGGGDFQEQSVFDNFVDIAQQQIARQQTQEVIEEPSSFGEEVLEVLVDNGVSIVVVLGFAGIGVLTVFKKKIKEWLNN